MVGDDLCRPPFLAVLGCPASCGEAPLYEDEGTLYEKLSGHFGLFSPEDDIVEFDFFLLLRRLCRSIGDLSQRPCCLLTGLLGWSGGGELR